VSSSERSSLLKKEGGGRKATTEKLLYLSQEVGKGESYRRPLSRDLVYVDLALERSFLLSRNRLQPSAEKKEKERCLILGWRKERTPVLDKKEPLYYILTSAIPRHENHDLRKRREFS